ncbi:hypothetical protein IFM89_036286 [Coptis chinensis]|uniref:Uncharacterized protein n=1 Tax=Coptis chinensis TaxID=261450 RepID=A0A835M354_9MAGN|nr:hypothetical protein IFM89_036286 [Coptis chinensis]
MGNQGQGHFALLQEAKVGSVWSDNLEQDTNSVIQLPDDVSSILDDIISLDDMGQCNTFFVKECPLPSYPCNCFVFYCNYCTISTSRPSSSCSINEKDAASYDGQVISSLSSEATLGGVPESFYANQFDDVLKLEAYERMFNSQTNGDCLLSTCARVWKTVWQIHSFLGKWRQECMLLKGFVISQHLSTVVRIFKYLGILKLTHSADLHFYICNMKRDIPSQREVSEADQGIDPAGKTKTMRDVSSESKKGKSEKSFSQEEAECTYLTGEMRHAKYHQHNQKLPSMAKELEEKEELNNALINWKGSGVKMSAFGIKRMGELNTKPFKVACYQKISNAHAAEEKALQLCSFWESKLADPSWHPFKVVEIDGVVEYGAMGSYCLRNVTVVSSGTMNDKVIMGFYGLTKLVCFRSCDRMWNVPGYISISRFHDLILYKGQFYTADSTGRTCIVDPHTLNVGCSELMVSRGHTNYLTESSGDLFRGCVYLKRVWKRYGPKKYGYFIPVQCRVCMWDQKEKQWTEVIDLGGNIHILFQL